MSENAPATEAIPPIPKELAKISARLARAHPFVALLGSVELCWRGLRFEGQCARLVRAAYVAVADERPALEPAARAWVASLAPWARAAAARARARLAAGRWSPGLEHDVFEANAALGALASVLSDDDTEAVYRGLAGALSELLERYGAVRAAQALHSGSPGDSGFPPGGELWF